MIEKEKLQPFLDEIEAVNKKHGLRLVPVLFANGKYAIEARFEVEEVSDKSKADGSADSGDQAPEEKGGENKSDS